MTFEFFLLYIFMGGFGIYTYDLWIADVMDNTPLALGIMFFWPLFLAKVIFLFISMPFRYLYRSRKSIKKGLSNWWVVPKMFGKMFVETGKALMR